MNKSRSISVLSLLAFTAGSLDGTLFSLFDKAFASIMTGNIILFGVAVASGSLQQLVVLCGALAGYVFGVFVGARIVRGYSDLFHLRRWPSRMVLSLSVTCILLIASLAFLAAFGEDTNALPFLFFLLALAMGIMATAVRRIGSSVSVTYLTGAITQFWERLATRAPLSESGLVSSVSVASLVLGAILGGVSSAYLGKLALGLPILSVLVAILIIASVNIHAKNT
ncbi:YoaK family protein [Nesterenkonia natronophila]|uniref:YoaK family protein n=1 Tax=Nesterenkonia natronophila TaxID=2174932 RepID=UPI0013146495|nr:YoaK family protein [Nesterenkonia natronophila]